MASSLKNNKNKLNFQTLTPFKNFIDLHHDVDVLLIHLQEAAIHLVQQGLAKIIYPIDKTSRYKINGDYDLTLLEKDRDKEMDSYLLIVRLVSQ